MAFDWLKSKFKKKPKLVEGEFREVPEAETEEQRREREELEDAKEQAREKASKAWARERVSKEAEEVREREKLKYERERDTREAAARKESEEERLKEHLETLSKKERKKFSKRYKKGQKEQVEAAFERWESGAPEELTTIQKIWVNVAGEPFGGHYEFRQVKRPLSPFERLGAAREMRSQAIDLGRKEIAFKEFKRERSLPYRSAKAAVGFGQFMAGTTMMGVAGTAQAILPRGEPRRARGLAPSIQPGLYGFGTAPKMDLSGLRRPLQPMVGMGGLGHLRSAVLPRITIPQTSSRIPLVPRPSTLDLSRLRRRP